MHSHRCVNRPPTGSAPVPVSGADGRLLGLVRAELSSPPAEERRALGCLEAAGGGGKGGMELGGAEEEEEEEEEEGAKEGKPCALRAERGRRRDLKKSRDEEMEEQKHAGTNAASVSFKKAEL